MKTKPTIISVVGARPQFVKLAPLVKELSKRFDHRILHTGQHYDDKMSKVFFRQLGIPRADINLGIGGGGHGQMTGRMLVAIEKYLVKTDADFVLVFGDTNSTLAGALAASKLNIPVGHVEAGMRSFVNNMPEEINRRLTDHISDVLFCPTPTAMKNLRREGINKAVVYSGDLMYELLDNHKRVIKADKRILVKHSVKRKQFLLVTAHRAANVDFLDNLSKLVSIVKNLPFPTIFPMHPRTHDRLEKAGFLNDLKKTPNLKMIEPLGYFDLLSAAAHARAVLTDSGGLQKEAFFLGTPVLTLRDETEWVETLRRGNRLVGLDKKRIMRSLSNLPKVKPFSYRIGRKRPSQIIGSGIAQLLTEK